MESIIWCYDIKPGYWINLNSRQPTRQHTKTDRDNWRMSRVAREARMEREQRTMVRMERMAIWVGLQSSSTPLISKRRPKLVR